MRGSANAVTRLRAFRPSSFSILGKNQSSEFGMCSCKAPAQQARLCGASILCWLIISPCRSLAELRFCGQEVYLCLASRRSPSRSTGTTVVSKYCIQHQPVSQLQQQQSSRVAPWWTFVMALCWSSIKFELHWNSWADAAGSVAPIWLCHSLCMLLIKDTASAASFSMQANIPIDRPLEAVCCGTLPHVRLHQELSILFVLFGSSTQGPRFNCGTCFLGGSPTDLAY